MRNTGSVIGYLSFPSPLGCILLAECEGRVCALDFLGVEIPSDTQARSHIEESYPACRIEPAPSSKLLNEAKDAILLYLSKGAPLPPFPVDTRKGTPFQQKVWEALRRIPFGETRSYQEIAQSIGSPRAARAVGQACGRNPVALLIPCHRVLASAGGMGGFSSGIHIKRAFDRSHLQ